MATKSPLNGVYSPALTPVDGDLAIDIDRFIAHCRRILAQGCHGLAVFGTTSEANSFSVTERLDALEALIAAGIAPGRLMPGTGCCALSDSVRLTRHAVNVGCGGVLMLPPFYYKGVSDDGLFKGFAEVIERVGDDRLKVYLYHIPPVAAVPFSPALVERLVKAYPDTVVGLKDSSGDWTYTETLLKTLPGFGVFSGTEIYLLANLRNGGAGTISATTNVNAAAIRDLYDHWQGDDAEARQDAVTRRRKLIQDFPMIPALKHVVAHHTGDEAWDRLRPPLEALAPDQAKALIAALDADGYRFDAGPSSQGEPAAA